MTGKKIPIDSVRPHVLQRVQLSEIARESGLIALTFDDGPRPLFLEPILEALAARGMKATFLMQGDNMAAHPGWAARAAREGHQVENHSYSHPHFTQIEPDAWREELGRTHEIIIRETGRVPRFFRPPYLDYNEAVAKTAMAGWNYRILSGSLSSEDWGHPHAGMLLPSMQEVEAGDIVICHEVEPTAADMAALLDWLVVKGLRSVTVDELEQAG